MNTKLADLIAAANLRYNAMTPTQQSAMWAAQRKSWVIGEMMLEHETMTREYAEAIYDKLESK